MLYRLTTAIRLALDSIRVHKLRSFLTVLGVVVGVASVVVVGAAIDGLGVYAESVTAKSFGSESYLIAQIASVGRLTGRELAEKQRYNKRIRPEDVNFLRTETGDSIIYSPYSQRLEDIKGGNQVYEAASVIGVSYTLPDIRDVPIEDGRFFTESEERMRAPVAIIGQDIRDALFPSVQPIGQKVRAAGREFTVIGLLERQGSSFGRSLDNPIYIPATLFAEIYGTQNGIAFFGKARKNSGLSMDEALDTTRVALRSRFHAQPGKPDNFDTLTPDSVRSFIDQILGVISAIVVPVTSISLIVGGIVIMNIMLVSVTERTREIGIRKSLGAKQNEILLQFLVESVILSLVGGLIGITAGAVLAEGMSVIFGIGVKITATYVVLSILVSSTVGIISGWYPARRAARLDPIIALRAE
ncbi:MAG TPA: ABC transporter permease [Terriglobales bacterium]|nr:ABC transporter permease [Terriglobales bacterium]